MASVHRFLNPLMGRVRVPSTTSSGPSSRNFMRCPPRRGYTLELRFTRPLWRWSCWGREGQSMIVKLLVIVVVGMVVTRRPSPHRATSVSRSKRRRCLPRQCCIGAELSYVRLRGPRAVETSQPMRPSMLASFTWRSTPPRRSSQQTPRPHPGRGCDSSPPRPCRTPARSASHPVLGRNWMTTTPIILANPRWSSEDGWVHGGKHVAAAILKLRANDGLEGSNPQLGERPLVPPPPFQACGNPTSLQVSGCACREFGHSRSSIHGSSAPLGHLP